MTPLFAKLQLKTDRILVVDAPASFEPELAALDGVEVLRDGATQPVAFALFFVKTFGEVEAAAARVSAQCAGDAVVWCAYPKGSSKKLRCEFNRDTGWAALEALGFETVRAVAIDEDWSGLRFRRSEYVKK